MKYKTKDDLIADLIDIIIDYMRTPGQPYRLQPIMLKDINGLAEVLFNKIYVEK